MSSAFALAQSSSIAQIREMTDPSAISFSFDLRVVLCGEVLASCTVALPCAPLFLHRESLRWSRLVACAILLVAWDGPLSRFPKAECRLEADPLDRYGEGEAEIVLVFPFDRDVDVRVSGLLLSSDLHVLDTDTVFVEAAIRVTSVDEAEHVIAFLREGRGVYYDKLDVRPSRTDFHALAQNKGALAAALLPLLAL